MASGAPPPSQNSGSEVVVVSHRPALFGGSPPSQAGSPITMNPGGVGPGPGLGAGPGPGAGIVH